MGEIQVPRAVSDTLVLARSQVIEQVVALNVWFYL